MNLNAERLAATRESKLSLTTGWRHYTTFIVRQLCALKHAKHSEAHPIILWTMACDMGLSCFSYNLTRYRLCDSRLRRVKHSRCSAMIPLDKVFECLFILCYLKGRIYSASCNNT